MSSANLKKDYDSVVGGIGKDIIIVITYIIKIPTNIFNKFILRPKLMMDA